MQSQSLISLWRKRLTCGTCAVALVGSLALYRQTVSVNPVTVAQKRWEAKIAFKADTTKTQYCGDGIAPEMTAANPVYQGEESHSYWRLLFRKHKI